MRPSYHTAVQWIANEDSPGDNDDIETLRGYLTVCLVADLFGKDQDKVAKDVYEARNGKQS